jgi:pimeloyl-ACP methyl ester carboxylesterase
MIEPYTELVDGLHFQGATGRGDVVSGAESEAVPPVVLLHGSGLSHKAFSRIGGRLARRGITWLAPDFVGSGDTSDWPLDRGPFSVAVDVAVARRAVLRAPAPPLVFGHSYGGAVALALAVGRAPPPIAGLVLFEPAVVHVLSEAGHPCWASVADVLDGLTRSFDADPMVWIAEFVDFWSQPGAFDRLPTAERARYGATGPVVHREVQALRATSLRLAQYAALDVPIWIVGGEQSPPAARAIVEVLGAALPTSARVTTAGGHMAPFTHPDALAGVIVDALHGLRR